MIRVVKMLFKGQAFLLKSFIFLVAGILFFAAAFMAHKTYVDAQIVNFYALNCAGGWDMSEYASGEPEVTSGLVNYTTDNSAYLENKISPITCSDFSGTLPPETYHTRVSVRFSWKQEQKQTESILLPPTTTLNIVDNLGTSSTSTIIEQSVDEINVNTDTSPTSTDITIESESPTSTSNSGTETTLDNNSQSEEMASSTISSSIKSVHVDNESSATTTQNDFIDTPIETSPILIPDTSNEQPVIDTTSETVNLPPNPVPRISRGVMVAAITAIVCICRNKQY